MSLFPRKKHGPELKCGGPGLCLDCTPLGPIGPQGPPGIPGPIGVQENYTDVIKVLKGLGITIINLDEHNFKLPCCYQCGNKEFIYHQLLDFFSCTQCFLQGNGKTLLENQNLVKSAEFWDFVTFGPQK